MSTIVTETPPSVRFAKKLITEASTVASTSNTMKRCNMCDSHRNSLSKSEPHVGAQHTVVEKQIGMFIKCITNLLYDINIKHVFSYSFNKQLGRKSRN